MTAREIAAAVRRGDRSARSVVEEHLAVIAAREPELHTFNLVTADDALAAADAVDAAVGRGEDPGPLAGVPVALKDNLCTRGVATTCSSRILDGWKPPYTATVVDRLRDAGGIAIGKTNLDEFAMGSSTENSAFGATRNPRDTTPRARWIEWWLGRGGGGRVRAARARLGHRRFDPPARRAVRSGRAQAHLRPGLALRPDRVRVEPRPDRPVRRDRGRRRAPARGDLGPRPPRQHVDRLRAGAARRPE